MGDQIPPVQPPAPGKYELLTLPVPFLLWYYVFGNFAPDFWVKLSASTALLILLALRRRRFIKVRFSVKGLGVGAVSAMLLYLFFWSGYHVMESVPGFVQTITSVYGFRGQTPWQAIALVLLFPIGPGEELYWRGLVQRYLRGKASAVRAIVLASLLYTSIHIVTLNPSLLLTALIGGLVWGYIYERYKDLFPVLVSHIIFDELIFVFLVIS